MQQCIKILIFLILNEVQHVSGDTPPIIRRLKLHKQSLVLHMWKVVGRCQVAYATWQRPTTARPTSARPTTFHICKTRGWLCSFSLLMMGSVLPETCWALFKIRNNKIWYTVASCVFHCKNRSSIHACSTLLNETARLFRSTSSLNCQRLVSSSHLYFLWTSNWYSWKLSKSAQRKHCHLPYNIYLVVQLFSHTISMGLFVIGFISMLDYFPRCRICNADQPVN
jgi:hypothetical protein